MAQPDISEDASVDASCYDGFEEAKTVPTRCEAAPWVDRLAIHPPRMPHYEISHEIARGGMGRIYAAKDLRLDREVAIKTLLPGADAEQFVSEAKITAQLPHPNIPPVYEMGHLEDGTPWLAMKLIRGKTLTELLEGRSSPKQDLPRFLMIFEQIAQAVGFAHSQGIIHRDLKPSNIMVSEFGEVQVMDWGLAKRIPMVSAAADGSAEAAGVSQDLTRFGEIMGTPGYMSPEQALGKTVDCRADVFALGSILSVILTGQPAFTGSTRDETLERTILADTSVVVTRLEQFQVDAELSQLIRRCLAAKVDDRPANAQEVVDIVAAYRLAVNERLQHAEAQRTLAEYHVAEQVKRRRVLLWNSGILGGVLLLGLGISLWQVQRAFDAQQQALANEQIARANEQRAQANGDLAQANAELAQANAELARHNAEQAERHVREALAQRDAKEKALQASVLARQKAMTALRTLTDEVLDFQYVRGESASEETRAFMRKMINLFENFTSLSGDDTEIRALKCEGYSIIAFLHHRLGEYSKAEKAYQAAITILQPLSADTANPDHCNQLVQSFTNYGVMLSNLNRWNEAEHAFRSAISIGQELISQHGSRWDYRSDLAKSYHNLGLMFGRIARRADEETCYRSALQLRKEVVAEAPSRPEFREELARSYNSLGLLLEDTGQITEAVAFYQAGLDVLRRLVAEFPEQADYHNDLAGLYVNFAILEQNRKKADAAKKWLMEGRPHHLQALKASPRHPTFRRYYRNHLTVLAEVHTWLHEFDDALRTAQLRATLGWEPIADPYDAAGTLARCISSVLGNDIFDLEKRQQIQKRYGDEAVRWLRQAVHAGLSNPQRLARDQTFASLRENGEFRKLLADLEENPTR